MLSSVDRSTQLEEDLRLYERLSRELPQHRELIERCVVDRRCQLAVEESRLPYEVPLLVVEQEDDMPLYFNGRHVRRLPPHRRRRRIGRPRSARRCASFAACRSQATTTTRGLSRNRPAALGPIS